MAAVPRSILTLGASLLSARASTRLKRGKAGVPQQNAVFSRLVSSYAAASVWKDAGVESGLKYERFRNRVPLSTYEQLAPHVERMKKGEANVLWPGGCQIYAMSSGTSNGRPKHVPVTEAMLDHYRRSSFDSLLWYTARIGHSGLFRGRHLYVGGSTRLAKMPGAGAFEVYEGELSAVLALNLPRWVEKHFIEPPAEVAQITQWEKKVDAIVQHTSRVDISAIAGIPSWILLLADALRSRASHGKIRVPHLQGLWPNLECYIHGGEPITPHIDELRTALGPGVNFHEVYVAAECFVAAQDADGSAGLRLMTDSGVFYEFLPMDEFDPRRLDTLGARPVTLEGVETGVDYALIASTPAGLARCVVGDVVRFLSTTPPRLVYVGRTSLQLNAFEEHVMECEVTDSLLNICRRNGWTIVNYHVAPLFMNSTTGRSRGRHEWWVELKPGTLTTPTGPIMAPELDTELRRLNRTYDAKRARGSMEAPFVRLVMPGVFEHWMRHHGKWNAQSKMPRCSSDRVIAEEIDGAVQFAKD